MGIGEGVKDSAATFDAFVTSLKAGEAYVNLHTGACAGGEIRGQIK